MGNHQGDPEARQGRLHMAALTALLDIYFSESTADFWCRYEDLATKMEEWYSDIGVMREEVQRAFEGAV